MGEIEESALLMFQTSPHAEDLAQTLGEAVRNAVKYGEAPVEFSVKSTSDTYSAVISDGGTGFDEDIVVEGSYGVLGMKERSAAVGASLEFGATRKGRFAVTLRIPSRA